MADAVRNVVWVDGRLVSGDEPVAGARDSAFAEGRGCYTSVRIQAGRPRFVECRKEPSGLIDVLLGAE